jgi:RNA polymerase sigma-70 factor (ECF subfamily)
MPPTWRTLNASFHSKGTSFDRNSFAEAHRVMIGRDQRKCDQDLSHFSRERCRVYVNADSESVTTVPARLSAFEFEGVFLAQYSRIVRIIGRIVNDSGRAEDLTLEVFWKLWRKSRTSPDPGGWLYRTAIRAGLNELRKQERREKYEHLFSFARPNATPEESHSEKETQQRVRKVLARLKTRDAELLMLRSEGASYHEIALVLNVSPTSIGTLLNRAERAFRKEYVNQYGQEL